jgi:hypothetical protein
VDGSGGYCTQGDVLIFKKVNEHEVGKNKEKCYDEQSTQTVFSQAYMYEQAWLSMESWSKLTDLVGVDQ